MPKEIQQQGIEILLMIQDAIVYDKSYEDEKDEAKQKEL